MVGHNVLTEGFGTHHNSYCEKGTLYLPLLKLIFIDFFLSLMKVMLFIPWEQTHGTVSV